MIVMQITPNPRFARGKDGELILTTKLAAAFYAENAEDEETLRAMVEGLIK
jgi:hypothetical protein